MLDFVLGLIGGFGLIALYSFVSIILCLVVLYKYFKATEYDYAVIKNKKLKRLYEIDAHKEYFIVNSNIVLACGFYLILCAIMISINIGRF